MNYLARNSLKVFAVLNRHWEQEKGATATEYGILVGFIAMAIVVGIGAFGIALNGVFAGLTSEVQIALGIP